MKKLAKIKERRDLAGQDDAGTVEASTVRLSRRDGVIQHPHGRVGIVIKGASVDDVFAEQAQRKRLVNPSLESGLPTPATGSLYAGSSSSSDSTSPVAGESSSKSTATTVNVKTPKSTSAKASSSSSSKSSSSASSGYSNTTKNGYPKSDLAVAISGGLTKASAPTAESSLGLDIEANDVGYIATIQIGSNKKPFRMLIDSGSADTWVPSTDCADCGKTHQALGKSVSSTFRSFDGSKFSIKYGTGAVKGTLGSDSMMIAGMTLKNQTFGIATHTTTDFSDPTVPFDGLMGLAKMELSNAQTPTPIDSLFAQGLVSAPVMGYKLGRVAGNKNDGEVTFGGVDAQKYQGTLLEIPNVSTQGFWEATMDRVKFGGKDLKMSGRNAILDTGTTLLIAPQADADAVHAAIPGSKADGQGGYTIPCTTSGILSFTFGGTEFEIDPRDMTFLPVDQKNLTGDCVSSLSAGTVGASNEWLVGAAFLKNVYFATNAQDNVIGLGKLK